MITVRQRIGFRLSGLRNVILARNTDTAAIGAETQPVVMALQRVADELSHRQRQMAVRTAVLERDRTAVLGAKQNDRLAENHAAERRAADFICCRGDVPKIPQEHGLLHGR